MVELEDDRVKLKLTISDHLLNVNGTLHGGIHATMLDYVQGMLLRAVTKEGCVTTSLTTQYLNSASEGEIFAESKILKLGYNVAFMEAEIKNSEGKILSKGLGSFKLLRS
ncbi:PaaI family thioesterase [Bacillus sp. J33]|uniref:PaaI family thioesterase n=1 Tax=Bacillus sp. J33 TaxID=935836 RepID=UPI001E48529C|nr:PaaI family thioesterase [Bacillus sp. J33]